MAKTFTVFRGSSSGAIVQDKTTRELGPNEVFIQLTHSGLCGTDEHYLRSGIVLGHEGVGVVKEVGSVVKEFQVGDRVGFGWVHSTCGYCETCLTGNDVYCVNKTEFGYHDQDLGSFGSHVVWDAGTLYKIPDGLSSAHAAPLMCAGATVWGALSQYGLKPTDRVGIVGFGGLGHLAIQMAEKMGCEVVVFSGSESKKKEALLLGASEFHVLTPGADLTEIKKINQMLICGSGQPDYEQLLGLMAAGGTIYGITVSFGLTGVPMLALLTKGVRIQGTAEAPRAAIKKMLDFCVRHNIRPVIMTWPMNQNGIEDAMRTLREGNMKYRGVLQVES
ncbi:NADP-dependent alcohol dehydrogenase C 2 [Lipomyces kononenkoae]